MRLAIIEASALSLWRDRPAFILTFLLPPTIFAIFALVFSSAAGGDLRISLTIAADADEVSQSLAAELERAPETARFHRAASSEEAAAMVRDGAADAGLAITRAAPDQPPHFTLYEDATREAAALAVEKALARLAPGADADNADANGGATLNRERVNPANAAAPMAAYYAAGVAMLFLFLSGFQSSLTLIEERDAGVMERIAAGPGGVGPAVDGKFAFISAQGFVQIGVIFAAAAVLFKVELTHAPGVLILAAAAAAIGAAGLTLGVTCLCRSKAQAHAVGVILSLVLAAMGGSMAPSFLMPAEVQAIGAAAPNGLGIAAFGAALWRGGGLAAAAPAMAALVAYGALGLIVARLCAKRALAP